MKILICWNWQFFKTLYNISVSYYLSCINFRILEVFLGLSFIRTVKTLHFHEAHQMKYKRIVIKYTPELISHSMKIFSITNNTFLINFVISSWITHYAPVIFRDLQNIYRLSVYLCNLSMLSPDSTIQFLSHNYN